MAERELFNQESFSIIINTDHNLYVPHYAELIKHNKEPVFIMPGPTNVTHLEAWSAERLGIKMDAKAFHLDSWRNADRTFRNWWQKNSNKVKTKNVLLIENDVYINTKINLNFPNQGVSGRDVFNPKTNGLFKWFQESKSLPLYMQEHTHAISPLAVICWNREALDAIADPRFDDLFKQDLFSEVRIGTLIEYLGLPLLHSDGLHLANYMSREVNEGPGIYHAIKKAQ